MIDIQSRETKMENAVAVLRLKAGSEGIPSMLNALNRGPTMGIEQSRASGAPVNPSDVAVLVADTGHRSKRVLELMEFASGAMPQLDDAADVVRVGAASGTCSSVPFMAALALGRHYALERAAPVLCLSNEDPYQRCAVVIRPYASA